MCKALHSIPCTCVRGEGNRTHTQGVLLMLIDVSQFSPATQKLKENARGPTPKEGKYQCQDIGETLVKRFHFCKVRAYDPRTCCRGGSILYSMPLAIFEGRKKGKKRKEKANKKCCFSELHFRVFL